MIDVHMWRAPYHHRDRMYVKWKRLGATSSWTKAKWDKCETEEEKSKSKGVKRKGEDSYSVCATCLRSLSMVLWRGPSSESWWRRCQWRREEGRGSARANFTAARRAGRIIMLHVIPSIFLVLLAACRKYLLAALARECDRDFGRANHYTFAFLFTLKSATSC